MMYFYPNIMQMYIGIRSGTWLPFLHKKGNLHIAPAFLRGDVVHCAICSIFNLDILCVLIINLGDETTCTHPACTYTVYYGILWYTIVYHIYYLRVTVINGYKF